MFRISLSHLELKCLTMNQTYGILELPLEFIKEYSSMNLIYENDILLLLILGLVIMIITI